MRKIERLKREALESCRFRGHIMKRFLDFKDFSVSSCKICDMQVVVVPHPLPNGIEISGEAVALHCQGVTDKTCTQPLYDCVECREC